MRSDQKGSGLGKYFDLDLRSFVSGLELIKSRKTRIDEKTRYGNKKATAHLLALVAQLLQFLLRAAHRGSTLFLSNAERAQKKRKGKHTRGMVESKRPWSAPENGRHAAAFRLDASTRVSHFLSGLALRLWTALQMAESRSDPRMPQRVRKYEEKINGEEPPVNWLQMFSLMIGVIAMTFRYKVRPPPPAFFGARARVCFSSLINFIMRIAFPFPWAHDRSPSLSLSSSLSLTHTHSSLRRVRTHIGHVLFPRTHSLRSRRGRHCFSRSR